MAETWLVIADREEARIFIEPPGGGELTCLGRMSSGLAEGEPTVFEIREYTRRVARVLDEKAQQGAFTRLKLMAEPKILGTLRMALAPETSTLVCAAFNNVSPGTGKVELVPKRPSVWRR